MALRFRMESALSGKRLQQRKPERRQTGHCGRREFFHSLRPHGDGEGTSYDRPAPGTETLPRRGTEALTRSARRR